MLKALCMGCLLRWRTFASVAVSFLFSWLVFAQAGPASKDEVTAWADFTAGIVEPGLLAVLPDPSASSGVWAAARGVLYYSSDGGGTWELVSRFHGRLQKQSDTDNDDEDDTDEQEQDVREEVAQELADELGLDDLELLDDPNNVDLEERTEDRLDEQRFGKDADNDPADKQRRLADLPLAIAVAKGRPNLVFVASTTGVFRSVDRGEDLRSVSLPNKILPRQILVSDDGSLLVLGTSRGIFYSEDLGDTWRVAAEPGVQREIVSLKSDLLDTTRVAVLTTQQVFLSSDGGVSYVPTAQTPPGRLRDVSFDPARPAYVFVATDQGLFVSANGGASWEPAIEEGSSLRNVPALRVFCSAAKAGEVLLLLGNNIFYVSGDGGRSFRETGDGLPAVGVRGAAIDPTRPSTLWVATGEGLYRYGKITVGEISEREQKRLLSGFRAEPSADAVYQKALKVAGLDIQTKSLGRALFSGYMPTLRMQGTLRKTSQQSISLEAGAPLDASSSSPLRGDFVVLALWDLTNVYDAGEALVRFERRMLVKRKRLQEQISQLYAERRGVQLTLLRHPPANEISYLKAELRLQELTALLDALSDGYFSVARAAQQKGLSE